MTERNRLTLEEIREMKNSGKFQVPDDAPTEDLQDVFWDYAKIVYRNTEKETPC